jgi:hypothetical protein
MKQRKSRWQIREEFKLKKEKSEHWDEKLKSFKRINSHIIDKSKEASEDYGSKLIKIIVKSKNFTSSKIEKFLKTKYKLAFRLIKKKTSSVEGLFFKTANEIILTSLIVLILVNVFSEISRFDNKNFVKNIRSVNYWPKIPTSLISLSQETFLWGNEALSDTFLDLASEQMKKYSRFGFAWIFAKQYDEMQKYVIIPKKKKDYLNLIEKQMDEKPYSWQLMLKRSEIEAELFMDSELENDIKQIRWLYPLIPEQPIQKLSLG